MKKIPLSHVTITDELRQAVLKAVDSGRYILADQCKAFESELAAYIGMKHCILSTSWTTATYLLHEAMGLKKGDEVIVPSHTAFPSIEPMIHHGAKPVFVDVDDSYCADPAAIEAAITPRTVGIMPVHLYGHPCDMDAIMAIAKKRGLWVLEDCAQAHGAKYKGRRVGSIGDASAFSFYPSKNLTVLGDGGCVMTNNDKVAERVRMMRDHGRKSKFTHEFPGWNLRFNEVQAAAGRVMLKSLDAANARRREIAQLYSQRLANIVKVPPVREWAEPVFHMYVIQHPKRDALAKYLQDNGIGTGIHYPVANHQQPAMTSMYKDLPKLPRTEALVDKILSLPIYGEMSLEDAAYVAVKIGAFPG
jgi:dTDP-4-amino-4,6-dideoxygalactose transaminase